MAAARRLDAEAVDLRAVGESLSYEVDETVRTEPVKYRRIHQAIAPAGLLSGAVEIAPDQNLRRRATTIQDAGQVTHDTVHRRRRVCRAVAGAIHTPVDTHHDNRQILARDTGSRDRAGVRERACRR